ncbi:MAG: anhydro-N-acetylmuramic acid kinase [Phycisphaerales bacterium]
MSERWAIGAMTGTSLDALDASLVRAEGAGPDLRVRVERHVTHALDPVRARLRAACDGAAMTARDFAALALDFGRLHAEALAPLAEAHPIAVAAIHGQTVFHAPPVSWQLLNPWPIAQRLGCAVASDLRGADLAAGGQGAPITPLADWIAFRHARVTAIVNLGGFCNITWLPAAAEGPAATRGADICPCNHLLDASARKALGAPFDADGAGARAGAISEPEAQALAAVLERAEAAGRSLGTGDEATGWVQAANLPPSTLLATVAHAVGLHIGRAAVRAGHARVVLAGGGSRNQALTTAIRTGAAGAEVLTSAEVGVPVEARESMEMAVLGLLALDRTPITLPAVTGRGASRCVDAAWCLPAG